MSAAPPRKLFDRPPLRGPGRTALGERVAAAQPAQFASGASALAFLDRIVTPASDRWAYSPNGKAGTTSVLAFLFEMEFGTPLTVSLTEGEVNSDEAAHRLDLGGVFRSLPDRGAGTDWLADRLKLAVVRDPTMRALSAFRYLCRSQRLGSARFAGERMRLSAVTGFDWTRDMDHPRGFRLFLRYVRESLKSAETLPMNAHWRPQWHNIRPDLFVPDITGRTEDLPAFFTAVAAALDQPLPSPGTAMAPRNAQAPFDPGPFLDDAAVRALLGQVYAIDYATWDYAPPGDAT